MDEESQTLLSSQVVHSVSLSYLCEKFTCVRCLRGVRHLCLQSKVILIILAWTAIVSELYTLIQVFIAVMISSNVSTSIGENHLVNAVSSPMGFLYALLAMIAMFYPLSGFLADVCCGRFRTIIVGLSIILISSITAAVLFAVGQSTHRSKGNVLLEERVPYLVFECGAVFFTVIGYAVYQANFIQLGLDQLTEAPSMNLSLFIHWAVWADTLGTTVMIVSFSVLSCQHISAREEAVFIVIPFFIFLCFPLFMILTCWKHRWFYTEPGQNNPYKAVIKVLNFVREHKYPLQRSAFTYCDNERPSRIDYAKERYGGPFTTEQVENVKTFVRILTLLVSLGPIFVMEVPSSFVGFAIFGLHTGTGYSKDLHYHCTIWILLESGVLRYIVGSTFLPVYTYIYFFLLRRSIMSKILVRLFIGLVIYILGILSMLAIDLAGHLHSVYDQGIGSHCMFTYTRNNSACLLYTSPSPRDATLSRMPSSA